MSIDQTRWALTHAAGRLQGRRGAWRGPGAYTYQDTSVFHAAPNRPFGYALHRQARKTHLVDGVYLAWCHGRFQASVARWLCGAQSPRYRLTEMVDPYPLCALCLLAHRTRNGCPRYPCGCWGRPCVEGMIE